MPRSTPAPSDGGFAVLRRRGAVTETLFLYECMTQSVPKLRVVADRLGLTVQAVSHLYRDLARRGLVELRGGRYALTVRGVAALQGTLSAIGDEAARRLERLQVVRTTRALATRSIARGQTVVLGLENGTLTARPGPRGPSRGRAASSAAAGELVEVGELEGIVPISVAPVQIWVVPREGTDALRRRAAQAVRRAPRGLIAAQGLEAVHLAVRATREPVTKFGAAAACVEASRLGVPSVAFVTEEELPRFLAAFAGPQPPPTTVGRLG
jgi:predicted transcriptional regulator